MNRVFLIVVAAMVVLVATAVYLRRSQNPLLSTPPAHGASFVLEFASPETASTTNDWFRLEQALLNRANKLGFSIYLEPISDKRLRVVAAVVKPAYVEMSKQVFGTAGILEFRLVHAESQQLAQTGDARPGYQWLELENVLPDGRKVAQKILVRTTPEPNLSGDLVKTAMVIRDQSGQPQIAFTLRANSAGAFAKVTRENVGRQLAIILDGRVVSAPVISGPITGGSGMISGHFSAPEALAVADVLESPLPVPVRLIESRTF